MPGESPRSMMQAPVRRPRKAADRGAQRRRWPILAPLAVVVTLAIAWSLLWYYAAATANRTLASWIDREAAAGRVYACGTQTISGFPLSFQARCADAGAEIKDNHPPFAVKATAVSFVAQLWHPTQLVGTITGPLSVAAIGQPPLLAADWSRAVLTLRGVPPDPEGIVVKLEEAHVDRLDATGATTLFTAKSADLQGRLTGGSPEDHPVLQATLHLTAAAAPTFHPLLAEPIDIEAEVVLRGFKDLFPKPWPDRFREMQAAGGGIEIKSLRLAQAKAIIVGTGKVNLNAKGRLDGVINVAVVGIEHIIPLLGIDRLVAQGIDRLSGTEGSTAQGMSALDQLIPGLGSAIRQSANASIVENLKKMGQPTTIDNQPAIVLPLRFVDGSAYLGMLRVGEVPALF